MVSHPPSKPAAWGSVPAMAHGREACAGACYSFLNVFVCVAAKLHYEGLLPFFGADGKKQRLRVLCPYLYKKPCIIDEDILFQETHLLIQVKSRAPFSRPCSASSPTVSRIQSSLPARVQHTGLNPPQWKEGAHFLP